MTETAKADAARSMVDQLTASPAQQYAWARRTFLRADAPAFHRATAFLHLYRIERGGFKGQG